MEEIYMLFVFLKFHESVSQTNRRMCRQAIRKITTLKKYNDIYTFYCVKEEVKGKQKEIESKLPIGADATFNVVLEKTWFENQRQVSIGLRGNVVELPNKKEF